MLEQFLDHFLLNLLFAIFSNKILRHVQLIQSCFFPVILSSHHHPLWRGLYCITVPSCLGLFQSSLLLYHWLSLIAYIVAGCSVGGRVTQLEYMNACVQAKHTYMSQSQFDRATFPFIQMVVNPTALFSRGVSKKLSHFEDSQAGINGNNFPLEKILASSCLDPWSVEATILQSKRFTI